MALEQVTEFFGVHLSPKTKQQLRIVAALVGKKIHTENLRDLLLKDISEKLAAAGLEDK